MNIQPVIDASGTKRWYLGNLLHREDGPAIECADGSKQWYVDDKLHRLDGPAIEYVDADGYKEWWVDGKRFTEQEFNKRGKGFIPSNIWVHQDIRGTWHYSWVREYSTRGFHSQTDQKEPILFLEEEFNVKTDKPVVITVRQVNETGNQINVFPFVIRFREKSS